MQISRATSGVSDIDLLIIRTVYVVIDRDGPKANSHYSAWTGPSGPTLLSQLRSRAEEILISAFPEANVDVGGSKAITISGGSLRREIDVIPSHWYDTADYQQSLQKKDRGIYIYLKKEDDRALNYPFLHMHQIQLKDNITLGNTKKIIRLLKTLIADYDDPSPLDLSSYDIASLVWHFENAPMSVQSWNELALLWVTKANLDAMVKNEDATKQLVTPDGTRKIIDKPAKFLNLVKLRNEVSDLMASVANELSRFEIFTESDARRVLMESSVAPVL